MNISLIASTHKDYVAKKADFDYFSGLCAGVCYMPNNFKTLSNENEEKTIKRMMMTKNNGHHSVFDHCYISLYLENGGDINVADNEGNTLLMKSVYLGYYDLADYILLNNADISLTNNNGESALILSADYPYIINLILFEEGIYTYEKRKNKIFWFTK